MQIEGWGRYPRHETELELLTSPDEASDLLREGTGMIARGNGRAYGDAAIGERRTIGTRPLDRMRAFDPATGRLTAEAGVLLADILDVFLPRGFFPPVVPGTKFVTLGGMIASDVHGKNHHKDGGFGDSVHELTLALPGGDVVTCSRDRSADLFWATVGGMGLTGLILDASFTLRRVETGWIRQRTLVAEDLARAVRALDETEDASYSVAWIDCLARGASLGRSLIFAGEHASRKEVEASQRSGDPTPRAKAGRLGVPVDLPAWTLNRASVSAFNEIYFRRGAAKAGEPFLVHWEPYFFPLDGVGGWNRIYGRRGFLQHQCVVPEADATSVLAEILERVTKSGKASFLAVLKKMQKSHGLISFPMRGYTLALDLQVRDDVFPLLDEIDNVLVAAGGRLYLAKDARQSPRTFEAGYPDLARFRNLRRDIAAEGRMVSRLSHRLGI